MSDNPAQKKKPRTKAAQRAESREQILDGAEYLFSKHGLHGVTLKDVSQRVGVHTSLLHYYFDDKQGLFNAVIGRRGPVTKERRIAALDQYQRDVGDAVTLEGALHAFLDTDLDLYMCGGEGWRNYGALGAIVSNTPEWGAHIMEDFDPVVLRLVKLLRRALPDCADEDIFWGYHFVTGALMLTLARTGRIDKLSGGLCQSDDFAAVKKRMATFMAGGLRAVCKQAQDERAAATVRPRSRA